MGRRSAWDGDEKGEKERWKSKEDELGWIMQNLMSDSPSATRGYAGGFQMREQVPSFLFEARADSEYQSFDFSADRPWPFESQKLWSKPQYLFWLDC